MKKNTTLVTLLLLACALIGASLDPKRRETSGFQFREFQISRTGILSIEGQSVRYLIVPQDKYPAQLKGVSVIDLDARIYVARFFEPGGVGVEGYFDVCFQLINGKLLARNIGNAGSLERINGSVYVRSRAYIFDSEKRVLLQTELGETKSTVVSLTDRVVPFSESTK